MEDATNDRIEREETLRKEFNDLEQSKDAALESLSQKMALMQASLVFNPPLPFPSAAEKRWTRIGSVVDCRLGHFREGPLIFQS